MTALLPNIASRSAMFMFTLSLLMLSCGEEFDFDPHTGTDGLALEFLAQAPPDELYTNALGEPIEVGIKVENLGAFDVPTTYLTLATEQDYVTITRWDTDGIATVVGNNQQRIAFPLEGKSMGNPYGTEEIFRAFATARIADPQIETIPTQLLASACYPYRTELHAPVCIDTDPHDAKNRRKSCTVSDLSFSGQGAPVAITNVGVQMLTATAQFIRPQFTITIANVGGGEVINPDGEAISFACSEAAINPKLFNTVSLTDVQLSGFSLADGQFDCRPAPIRLSNGEAEITCTLKSGLIRSDQDTYSTDLSIMLSYGYLTSVSTEFRLRKLP